jgi:hypothetical protein
MEVDTGQFAALTEQVERLTGLVEGLIGTAERVGATTEEHGVRLSALSRASVNVLDAATGGPATGPRVLKAQARHRRPERSGLRLVKGGGQTGGAR